MAPLAEGCSEGRRSFVVACSGRFQLGSAELIVWLLFGAENKHQLREILEDASQRATKHHGNLADFPVGCLGLDD